MARQPSRSNGGLVTSDRIGLRRCQPDVHGSMMLHEDWEILTQVSTIAQNDEPSGAPISWRCR